MAFWNTLERFGERTALITETGEHIAYNALLARADEIAGAAGSRCLAFLMCRNCADAAAGYVGFLRRGIVPVLLAENLDTSMLEGLLESYRPAYFYLPSEKAPDLPGVTAWRGESYTLLHLPYEQDYKLPEELALLLTTSGSTGSPKLVRQSRKNISANAASIADYLDLNASERPITTLPMHYTYGLSIINSHLLAGAAVLLTNRSMVEKEFWEFFRQEQASSFGGVPYTYEILRRLSFFDMELPSLRTMTQAGGKLAPKLHREFAEYAAQTGRSFIVMYGQTEATARMGYLPAEDALRKCGSMGIAIPGGRFRLMEDKDVEITEPDRTGELVYEGENVTMGYAACRAGLAKGDERGGVLFTGDMAMRDADGYYYITGRKKRFLKLFGMRVNMDEIERLLKAEYEGVQAACAGEDDHMRIFLAGADEAFCRQAELWIAAKTGLHPSGLRVFPIDVIPKNSAGKTLYQKLPDIPF